jgi:hypothetical protein
MSTYIDNLISAINPFSSATDTTTSQPAGAKHIRTNSPAAAPQATSFDMYDMAEILAGAYVLGLGGITNIKI